MEGITRTHSPCLLTWKSELNNFVQEGQVRAKSGPISGHVRKIATKGPTSDGMNMTGAELILRFPMESEKKNVDEATLTVSLLLLGQAPRIQRGSCCGVSFAKRANLVYTMA